MQTQSPRLVNAALPAHPAAAMIQTTEQKENQDLRCSSRLTASLRPQWTVTHTVLRKCARSMVTVSQGKSQGGASDLLYRWSRKRLIPPSWIPSWVSSSILGWHAIQTKCMKALTFDCPTYSWKVGERSSECPHMFEARKETSPGRSNDNDILPSR